jgi:hypothetical protein
MMKMVAIHFCPECGESLHVEKDRRSFVLLKPSVCAECKRRPQMTGLGIMLIGIVASLPTSLFLCAGATEVGNAIFGVFTALAVMRWIQQIRAMRRHAANKKVDHISER